MKNVILTISILFLGIQTFAQAPIISVSPDSLVVGVLLGSTKTEILTISNQGGSNLSFNLTGGGFGYALHFNGTDSYVIVPDNPTLDISPEITIAAWIRFEVGGSGHPRIISKGADAAGYEIKMLWDNGPSRIWQFPNGVDSKTWLVAGQWYHLAATYDGSRVNLYLNGNLDTSGIGWWPLPINAEDLYIGQKSSWAWDKYKGIIDDLSLWRIVLSQNQIQALMNAELKGTELDLVAYWQFNEGTGYWVHDLSINENHGWLHGGVIWTNSSAPMLPNWLSITPDSGVCFPNSSKDIELLFDATELDTGNYYGSLVVNSNDTTNPYIVVPIHLLVSTTVGVKYVSGMPIVFNLYQNYPNPFNPNTTIKYSIPQMSKVSLTLFDLLGEEVKTLVNEEKMAGNYTVEFNASNLPSGVYFYQLKAGESISTKKMILLK